MRSDLNACPSCGKITTGIRKMRDVVPEEYWIECKDCGYTTKRYKRLSAATKEWNYGKKSPV